MMDLQMMNQVYADRVRRIERAAQHRVILGPRRRRLSLASLLSLLVK